MLSCACHTKPDPAMNCNRRLAQQMPKPHHMSCTHAILQQSMLGQPVIVSTHMFLALCLGHTHVFTLAVNRDERKQRPQGLLCGTKEGHTWTRRGPRPHGRQLRSCYHRAAGVQEHAACAVNLCRLQCNAQRCPTHPSCPILHVATPWCQQQKSPRYTWRKLPQATACV
jgi:hypothetical protein